MQNGNLYTESQLLGPYANVNLNPTQSMSMTAVPPNQLIGQAIFAPPPAFYVNIHTAAFPNGAIRGQLTNSPPITGMEYVARPRHHEAIA